MSWSCRHSSRMMHFLECMFILEHCTALRWRVTHRVIPLLSISSPCRGIIFYRYRERARRWLVLEVALEESRIVALT